MKILKDHKDYKYMKKNINPAFIKSIGLLIANWNDIIKKCPSAEEIETMDGDAYSLWAGDRTNYRNQLYAMRDAYERIFKYGRRDDKIANKIKEKLKEIINSNADRFDRSYLKIK